MKSLTAKEVLRAILNRIYWVMLVPFIAVAITAFINYNVLNPIYTARSTMYVLNRQNTETVQYSDLTAGGLLIADYKELAMSARVINGTAAEVGLENLEGYDITVSAAGNTRIIDIAVQGKNPDKVADIANAIARNLSSCIIDVMKVENISVIDKATSPKSPSGPNKMRNIFFAGVIGLLFSAGIAVLAEAINTKIKTAEDVLEQLSLPVLAKIPNMDRRRKHVNGHQRKHS